MDDKIIHDVQNYEWLSWTKMRNSSGTVGSFLKAYSDLGGAKTYYKLSNYDPVKGITGHECVNEIIADRLLTILGIEHLPYQLIHAKIRIQDERHTTWICASHDFKQPGDSKIALDAYYQAERLPGEQPLDFCIRNGWGDYIWEMLTADFLILNRDRHGANIEVLRNSKNKTLRPAPLFDHGLSLIFNCADETAAGNINVMEDKPVQCFVGSHSALDNLKLIPKGETPKLNSLQESDREIIMQGLESVIPENMRNKIWEMIWKRWLKYEDFCCQR